MYRLIRIHIVFFVGLIAQWSIAQNGTSTVPTAIYIGNAAFEAPVHGAKVALTLQEDFGNQKRPVSTFIGEFVSDTAGVITVSLIPDKSYLIQTSKDGFYTQLSKVKTANFSRTQQNKKGISLRPRNIISIKGNIVMPKGKTGTVTLKNKITNYTRTEVLDATGDYDIKAVKGNDYELHVVIEGVMDTLVSIEKKDLSAGSGNIPFVYNFVPNAPKPNYRAGDVLDLEAYNLKFIDRTVRLSGEIWLDTLTRILRDNPNVKIEIQIHTDARKSDRLNLILSKKRKETVEAELIERGVSANQYVFELKGEDEILNDCVDGVNCSRREHAVNNRVSLLVKEGAFLFEKSD
ncbi:OmpA family protein [Aureispira sp. CCB-E]|uniref:OmpA family protein n=1 Tax=Aureispira sp. CCB-E TaxID=3051121 RepID=UPI002868C3B3|nr:OmpA family protein [Aureispira sp. CCB-E]WMX16109.1 OmpA family protein [Aureispira sp. CCB-E]